MADPSSGKSRRPNTKTQFVRSFLDENPRAGFRAVNQAWNEAGHEGSISETLVHRTRSEKGLTGNLRATRSTRSRATRSAPGGRRGRPPRSMAEVDARRVSSGSRPRVAPPTPPATARQAELPASLEAEFDRLLFRVMDRGMPEVEEALRTARRLFVLRSID